MAKCFVWVMGLKSRSVWFFVPPHKANCHPELQAPSVEAVAGSIGYVHVPGEVLTLHAFATQDYVFSCVSGCACCVDV